MVRDLIVRRPDLKIILMSASLHADLFTDYFGHCPRLHVPGFTHPVEEYTLEHVLALVGGQPVKRRPPSAATESATDAAPPEEWALRDMDSELEAAFTAVDPLPALGRALQLIRGENVSVDYACSTTGCTALMVAAARGQLEMVANLLRLGATKTLTASNGWDAADFAAYWRRTLTVAALEDWGRNNTDSGEMQTEANDLRALRLLFALFRAQPPCPCDPLRVTHRLLLLCSPPLAFVLFIHTRS